MTVPAIRFILFAMLALAPCCLAVTQTVNQTMDVTIVPAYKVSPGSALTLLYNGGSFLDYTGTLTVSYKARTGTASTIALGMRVSTNFAPSGGPSAAAGTLFYTCGTPTLGAGCSGSIAASTSSAQTIVTMPSLACTGGGSPCSSSDPNTVQLSFALQNLPPYATGPYSGQLLFTFSAF